MPHEISSVDDTGQSAHYNMVLAIKTFAEANGWTTLRYDTSTTNHELIMLAPGLSGIEQIYVGIQTYQDADADYYNLSVAGFTGYVAGNTFETQPGYQASGVPCHNRRVDYWLTLNGQRMVLVMKVGTPVYEMAYLGKFLPYAKPDQYPYPVLAAGMLNGKAATRFSDTSHSMPFKGARANMRMRFNDGVWRQPKCYPWHRTGTDTGNSLTGDRSQKYRRSLRDTNGSYSLLPIILLEDALGLFGEPDGVRYISGFNNSVENTLTHAGKTWVVFQDVYRSGFTDYVAVRMD